MNDKFLTEGYKAIKSLLKCIKIINFLKGTNMFYYYDENKFNSVKSLLSYNYLSVLVEFKRIIVLLYFFNKFLIDH